MELSTQKIANLNKFLLEPFGLKYDSADPKKPINNALRGLVALANQKDNPLKFEDSYTPKLGSDLLRNLSAFKEKITADKLAKNLVKSDGTIKSDIFNTRLLILGLTSKKIPVSPAMEKNPVLLVNLINNAKDIVKILDEHYEDIPVLKVESAPDKTSDIPTPKPVSDIKAAQADVELFLIGIVPKINSKIAPKSDDIMAIFANPMSLLTGREKITMPDGTINSLNKSLQGVLPIITDKLGIEVDNNWLYTPELGEEIKIAYPGMLEEMKNKLDGQTYPFLSKEDITLIMEEGKLSKEQYNNITDSKDREKYTAFCKEVANYKDLKETGDSINKIIISLDLLHKKKKLSNESLTDPTFIEKLGFGNLKGLGEMIMSFIEMFMSRMAPMFKQVISGLKASLPSTNSDDTSSQEKEESKPEPTNAPTPLKNEFENVNPPDVTEEKEKKDLSNNAKKFKEIASEPQNQPKTKLDPETKLDPKSTISMIPKI
ncbi:MAG: hypothetical protein KAJ86_05985 [Alphaproteobacteria bacterium]|nr:hypothetical protein [Alphaproteobacteria bacterium]